MLNPPSREEDPQEDHPESCCAVRYGGRHGTQHTTLEAITVVGTLISEQEREDE